MKRKVIQRAAEFPDTAYRRSLKVRVLEAGTQRRITNATAVATVQDDVRSFFFGEYHTDGAGEFVVDYPPQAAVSFGLGVNSPGLVSGSRSFSMVKSAAPEFIELPLEHGQIIGGLVEDPNSNPIAGARLVAYEVRQTATNRFTREDFEAVQTGADGRWKATVGNGGFSNLVLEVSHPDYEAVTLTRLDAAWMEAGGNSGSIRPSIRTSAWRGAS